MVLPLQVLAVPAVPEPSELSTASVPVLRIKTLCLMVLPVEVESATRMPFPWLPMLRLLAKVLPVTAEYRVRPLPPLFLVVLFVNVLLDVEATLIPSPGLLLEVLLETSAPVTPGPPAVSRAMP
jgi:hypothetical protein